jgi:AraC-like DNA-binding protein
MALYSYPPSPALAPFIRVFRVVDFVFEHAKDLPFKPYPPRPEHCLSFYPRDTEVVEYADSTKKISNVRSALIGMHHVVTNRYVGQHFLLLQVVFQPGALFRLTGIPSFELTNSYLDAETVFSKEIKEVNEKLREAKDHVAMIAVVEAFLWGMAQRSKRELHVLDQVGNLILQSPKPMAMDELASKAYLSLRQYERKFLERMGVSPKTYQRIVRFETAYRMKNQQPELDWLSVAIDSGYYDYQHLAKDYKAFTAKTPIDFHMLELSAPERKFGVADTY